jgi:hexosaminidase
MVWQEMLDNLEAVNMSHVLGTNVIIESWKGGGELIRVAQKGYKTVFTLYPEWYLDHINGTTLWNDWQSMYLVEPLANSSASPSELELILGGEVNSWDPFEDGSNYLANAFPRAYAVAERLWSAQSQRDVDDAARRLHILRCLLIGRGTVRVFRQKLTLKRAGV